MSIIEKTASELVDLLEKKEISSSEVTSAFCDRIEAVDQKVRAFLHYDRSAALQRARQVDSLRAQGKPVGLLAGVPVAVKDILCARGEPTTCGSKMLENFKAPYDAAVITKLDQAGAVRIGRVNMDEFAMGSSKRPRILGISLACRAEAAAGQRHRSRHWKPLFPSAPIPAAAFASQRVYVASSV
jgi:aspartyl-tRNA(Asn)/glutamyl-tRNA(Gln) amidotransferase subunit A